MNIQDIFQKFAHRPAGRLEAIQNDTKYSKENKPAQNSKRRPARQLKLERQQKELLELKLAAEHPELVQADDCGAPDPEYLVWLRQYPGMVDVPMHWRQSNGRFLHKQKGSMTEFRIPAQYLQQALERKKQTDQLNTQSVKQLARQELKVPSHGTTLYIIPEAELQDPNEYLNEGEVFYQGRLQECRFRYDFKPGEPSERLRAALGLKEGEEYPWEIRRRTLGIK